MEAVLKGFSTRDVALLIWLSILFVWSLFNQGVRSSIWNLIKCLFDKRISPILFLIFAYVVSLVMLLSGVDLWSMEMMRDTIYWFFGTAFVLVMNINKINQIEYFKGTIKSTFKVTLIVELIGHLYTFSLPVELVLVPILLLLGILQAYAEVKKDNPQVEKLLKRMLVLLGMALVLYSLEQISKNFAILWNLDNLKSILLTPILTVLYLPIVYLIAIYAHYETLFVSVNIMGKDAIEKRKIKIVLLKAANVNLNRISYLDKNIYRLEKYDSADLQNCLQRLYSLAFAKPIVPPAQSL